MSTEVRTTPEYWQKETGRFTPFEVRGNPFSAVLERFLPKDSAMSCVEIGAYPGGNLCYLAKKFGYQPYAIEYRDDADDIRRLFEFNGLPRPGIFQEDFLAYDGRTFDIVTSFGFVEHFDDPEKIIERHIELTNPGGYLIVSVPHFWGLQGILRGILFTKEALNELFATHNMRIMHLHALKRVLKKRGIEILYIGHVMNGQFWIPHDSSKIREDRRLLARLWAHWGRHIGAKIPSNILVSPMILAICRRV